MESGRFGALKPGELGLSCKANEHSDAGTRGVGLPITSDALLLLRVVNATLIIQTLSS